MKDLYLIPECYVDTNLVETLLNIYGHPTKGVNHQQGCNNVAKTMKKSFENSFSVGVMDADKQRPTYLNEFEEIGKSEHLTLLKHKNQPHYIILVKKSHGRLYIVLRKRNRHRFVPIWHWLRLGILEESNEKHTIQA